MLPIPPEQYGGAHMDLSYGHGPLPTMQSLGYVDPASHYEMGCYNDYGLSRQHLQPTATVAATIPRATYVSEGNHYVPSSKVAPVHGSSNAYGVASGPLLPPIRAPDRFQEDHQHQTRSKRAPTVVAQPKEEKVGGVAAHLDYKMDEMIDFVSEMAQGMYGIYASKICLADIDMTRSVMSSKSPVHPEFRRYVSQVLTSTRLPSSTILLGLHYLAVRMTMLSARGKYTYDGGNVYHMLTTALLLGSKFLDDNTFQNRSWSDVSNIPVKKLNTLESEWLQDIKWDMHFDPSDSKGFDLWQRRWKSFQTGKIDSLTETMQRTSLDNNRQQPRTLLRQPTPTHRYVPIISEAATAGHHSERSTPQWNAPHYDRWAPLQSEYSPPSAPETGPNTPDYAMPSNSEYGPLPPIHPSLKMPPALHILPSNAPPSGYLTPQYPQYHNHGFSCACNYCMPHGERYFMSHGYGQAVVG